MVDFGSTLLFVLHLEPCYTLSEAWSGVNWADLMAAQGASVIKIGPKGALGSHEIRPIHSAPSLGQNICTGVLYFNRYIRVLR